MSHFRGPLRRHPSNPRYFTDDSGAAIYLTGSHTWAVLQDMWLEGTPRRNMDYDGFLDLLEENGHNFLRYWQWMHPRNAAWSDTPTLFDPHRSPARAREPRTMDGRASTSPSGTTPTLPGCGSGSKRPGAGASAPA